MRLLSLFTMGVPSTESAVPMAHLLPLILSSLLCFGGSLLYASDWTDTFPLNSVSFMALFVVQFCFLAQGCVCLRSVHGSEGAHSPDQTCFRLQLAVFSRAGDVEALPRARGPVLELDPPVARTAQAGEPTLWCVATHVDRLASELLSVHDVTASCLRAAINLPRVRARLLQC